MKEHLPDIDKLFKAALDSHEEAPSDKVWDALDRELDKNKVIDLRKKYIYLKRISIALLLLLIGAGIYTFITLKNASELLSNAQNKSRDSNTATSSINTITGKEIAAPHVLGANKTNENKRLQKSSLLPKGNINELANPVAASSQGDAVNVPATINASNNKEETFNSSSYKKIKKASTAVEDTIELSVPAIIFNPKEKVSNTLTKSTSRKRYFTKRRQNASITNSLVEEEIKTGTTAMASPITATTTLPAVQKIYPELLPVVATAANKNTLAQVNFILPKPMPLNLKATKKTTSKKAGTFALTAFFSPNISSDFLKDDDGDNRPGRQSHDEDGDDIKKGEHHQSSQTFGLLVDYSINSHWALQSGLTVTNRTIAINPKRIYAANNGNGGVDYLYNCSSGYTFLSSKFAASPVAGDSLQTKETKNTLQYLSIPLLVKYNFSFKRINLFTSIGTSLNILTKGRLSTEIEAAPGSREATTSTNIIGLKKCYFSGSIGLGLSFPISNKFAFSFMPSYNFALGSSTKGAVVKTYTNTICLGAGIIYKLY